MIGASTRASKNVYDLDYVGGYSDTAMTPSQSNAVLVVLQTGGHTFHDFMGTG